MKRNPDLERQILLTIEADTDDPMAAVSLEGLLAIFDNGAELAGRKAQICGIRQGSPDQGCGRFLSRS